MKNTIETRKTPSKNGNKWLQEVRENLGLTRYKMAQKLHLRAQDYYYLETKAQSITAAKLCYIVRKLSLDWATLGAALERDYQAVTWDEIITKREPKNTP